MNCGQNSSSFSRNHQRDPPGIIQGGEKNSSVGICGTSKLILLITQDIKSDEYSFVVDSDQLGYRAPSRGQGKIPVIDNIMTCLKAFSRFMAVILSTEATRRKRQQA